MRPLITNNSSHLSMWGYKLQIIFWFCFKFFDQTSLTYSSNLWNIFLCSGDIENIHGIFNPPWCKYFKYHRLLFTFIAILPSYWVKKCICFDTYLWKCLIVFPLSSSLHAIVHLSCKREDTSLLTFKISVSYRLPWVLKKVEPTNARLDFKCFNNNHRNFFIYVFNNHFNRRKHFVCFVLRIYYCTLLIKVLMHVCSSIIMIGNGMLRMNIMSERRTLCCR